jgi:hypothetical protein
MKRATVRGWKANAAVVLGGVSTLASSDLPRRAAPDEGAQRSSRNPGSSCGRSGALAANHPVRYIHCAMRVSFG